MEEITTMKPLEVTLALDPGWTNLGWVLVVYDPDPSQVEYKKSVRVGTHNLNFSYSTPKMIHFEHIAQFYEFVVKSSPMLRDQSVKYNFRALVIEQQPRSNPKYNHIVELQEELIASACVYFRADPRCIIKPAVFKVNGNSTKAIFGTLSRGDTYHQRKTKLMDRINDLVDGIDPVMAESRDRYPLLVPISTHHEGDALACLNVYVQKLHDETVDIGLYKKTSQNPALLLNRALKPKPKPKAKPRKRKLEELELEELNDNGDGVKTKNRKRRVLPQGGLEGEVPEET